MIITESPGSGSRSGSVSSGELTHRQLLTLFMPLAMSTVMMVVAMQAISAGIARLPQAQASLAAYGVIMAVSIFLEAPIIVIIHVANSLVVGPTSYRRVLLFSALIGGGLSLIHGLIAVTPLYDLIFRTLIGLPGPVADLGRVGFLIMTPWTVAISWRRFYQGILVSHGYTGLVGRGTTIRLVVALSIMGAGMLLFSLPGITIGSLALSISVVVEAVIVTWFARPLGRRILASSTDEALPWKSLLQFFWPLGLTSLLAKLMPPLLSAVVARSPDPEVHLAAWPVAYGLVMVFMVPTQMLSQLIIPNARDPARRKIAMSFAYRTGAVLTLALGLALFTSGGMVYFRDLIGLSGAVLSSSLLGARMLLMIPVLQALQNALYGAFSGLRTTVEIMVGSVCNMLVIILLAFGLLSTGLPGTAVAAVLLSLGIMAEIAILAFLLKRRTGSRPVPS